MAPWPAKRQQASHRAAVPAVTQRQRRHSRSFGTLAPFPDFRRPGRTPNASGLTRVSKGTAAVIPGRAKARARNPFGRMPGGEMDSGLDAGASPRNDARGCDAKCMPDQHNLPVVPTCRSCPSPQIRTIIPRIPHPRRGAARDRHGRWERDAMDAAASGAIIAPTNDADADGEVVWSWRSDAGAKVAGAIPRTTVAKEPGHREEHEGNR